MDVHIIQYSRKSIATIQIDIEYCIRNAPSLIDKNMIKVTHYLIKKYSSEESYK